jgi:hypothetical protein
MNRRLLFSALLTLAFLAGTGVLACHHELWRDEMQAWLISRDSPNLWTLCLQGRYDGTPPLWYLLLRPVTLVTHRPEAMQALNWGLAGLTFFIICHYSPFSRLQKVLLLFNYYLFYEYGTVCRQYLLGVLFLSVACRLFPAAEKRPWAFTWALVAAALASVYSLILAVALAVAFWGAFIAGFPSTVGRRKFLARIHLPPLLALAGGIGFAIYCMIPEADTFYGPAFGWHLGWDLEKMTQVACAFTNAHFLLPRPVGLFAIPAWQLPFSWIQYLAVGLALPLLGVAVLFLWRSASALVFYGVAVLGLTLFLYSKYLGFNRHVGFLFLAFFFALWLKKQLAVTGAIPAPAGRIARGADFALTLLLATQAVTGVWAARLDYDQSFSCGKKGAADFQARHLEKAFIAIWPDWDGAVFAGYLDRSVYYPQSKRWGSFTRWDRQFINGQTDDEALQLAEAEAHGAPIVMVVDHFFTKEFMQAHGLVVLNFYQGAIVPFEDYLSYYKPAAGQPMVAPPIPLTENESPAQVRGTGEVP